MSQGKLHIVFLSSGQLPPPDIEDGVTRSLSRQSNGVTRTPPSPSSRHPRCPKSRPQKSEPSSPTSPKGLPRPSKKKRESYKKSMSMIADILAQTLPRMNSSVLDS